MSKLNFLQFAQYIGEMCRYVLAASKDQKNHCVRAVIGNGLRPQIWQQFKDTFNIAEIYEFYGSTEGNSNFSKDIQLI